MGPFPHDAPPAAISEANPAGTDGFEFVEFAHEDPEALRETFRRQGYGHVANHRRKAVELWQQGDISYLLNAEPGTDGSDWNVSNIKVGLHVYVNQNPSETRVTISDIANGGNPTLSWGTKNEEVTLTVSGNDIVAEGTFTDKVGGASPTQGRLEATCASWHEG